MGKGIDGRDEGDLKVRCRFGVFPHVELDQGQVHFPRQTGEDRSGLPAVRSCR